MAISPDRRHIFCAANETSEGGENSGIFVATIDGKDDRQILFFGNFPNRSDLFTSSSDGTGAIKSNGTDNLTSEWSSDGKFILFQKSHGSGPSNTDL